MTESDTMNHMSAEDHAKAMADYIKEGEARAYALGNRGPIRFDSDGNLHHEILDAYREHGFYVFENVVGDEELAELRADVENVLNRAPVAPESEVDAQGRPALGPEYVRYPYRFAKPLSDPLGGTTKNKGRHPVKMSNPTPSKDAPSWTIELLHGNLHLKQAG